MEHVKFTPYSFHSKGLRSWFRKIGTSLAILCGLLLFTSAVSAQITATITATPISCNGANDGSLTAQGFGGWAPYDYFWSTGDTAQTISNLAPGTYTVTVQDMDLALAIVSFTLGSSQIDIITTASFETCVGSGDATATVVVQNPINFPYSYLWSDGQTTPIATGLSAGTYGVTVTDGNGCTVSATQDVELSPEGVWIMTKSTPALCGENDGTANVNIMTGVAPFTIIWSNGGTTEDITGLAPGTYSVTVTDVNGCSNSESVVVTATDAPDPGTIFTSDATTFCTNDGDPDIVNVTATGNTAPNFRFVVTDAATGNILAITDNPQFDFEGVPAGVCNIYGIGWEGTLDNFDVGNNLSEIMGCFALTNPIPVTRENCMMPCVSDAGTLTLNGSDLICYLSGTITISATPDGNIVVPAGYETLYVLTSGNDLVIQATSSTPSFDVSAVGDYTIHTLVYDPLTLDLSIVVPGTTTGFDVNALLIQGGGDICASLDVAGAKVSLVLAPTVSISPIDAGVCTGSSVMYSTLATGTGLTYSWTASAGSFDDATSATPVYTMMMPGTYDIEVTVTDVNGCTATDATTVTINDNPVVAITPDAPSVCVGETVQFGTTVAGTGFTYSWTASAGSFDDASSPSPIYTMIMPGTYDIELTVTDANGCSGSASTTVTINANPTVDITPDNASVCVGETVQLDANATGPGLTYSWTASAGSFDDETSATPVYTMMMPGTYDIEVTVTDANGCTAMDATTVTINPNPTVEIDPANAQICLDETIKLSAVSTATGLTYDWSTTGGSLSSNTAAMPDFSAMATGTYTITVVVTDANGCTGTATAEVEVVDPDAGTLTIDDALVCLENGTATVSATPDGNAVVPNGFETIYVLTSGPGLVIQQVNSLPTFDVTAIGNYTLHTLVYNPSTLDLSIVVPGVTTGFDVNALLIQGGGNICATLDVAGAPVEVFMRKIGDKVFLDNNFNGLQDGFEPGYEGAVVKLLTAGPDGVFCTPDDVEENRDTTDANGNYCFNCVLPGEYIVSFMIMDTTLQFTQQDAGMFADAIDSDADPMTGKTEPFTIELTDGDDLTIDAGVNKICVPYTVGGLIGPEDIGICRGDTPPKIESLAPPTGGQGPIEYMWMMIVDNGTPINPDPTTWMPVPNSDSECLQLGPLNNTIYLARCARAVLCGEVPFVESNIIKIEVFDCPQPQSFDNFTANVMIRSQQIELNWGYMDQQIGINYFIERSVDNGNTFQEVGSVRGQSVTNNTNEYKFIDLQPRVGKNIYRIKRTGFGTVDYSELVEARIGNKGMEEIFVYPNPVTTFLNVERIKEMTSDGELQIINELGQIVYRQVITKDIPTLNLQLDNLTAGNYVLRILQNDTKETMTVKFVKQQ